ncbi:melanocortin receptor 4-like [Mercenaria mercenaria]|uniref:melanocortin receptor 4-like n=1 Tax=Mercenaria mercenaria TaxID=6596 RepID=UPI001E1DBF79|nr:melanocortin receptor 4-like [Mercenaria mercenaria]
MNIQDSNNSLAQLDTKTYGNLTDDLFDFFNTPYEADTKPVSPVITSIVLCGLGILANSLSIFAILYLHNKLSTHLKLIINLCVSDALIVVPTLVSKIIYMTETSTFCSAVAERLIIDLALLATLLNLLMIAVDHYFAILRPLLYRRKMTNFRGNFFIIGIWVTSLFGIALEILAGVVVKNKNDSLCGAIAFDEYDSEICIVGFIFVVLLVVIVIYTRIYIRVVKLISTHERRRYHHYDSGSFKALVTTSLFVGTFVLFWTPIGIFNVYSYMQTESYILKNLQKNTLIGDILFLILQLNTIADPIIYALRLPPVQRGCKALVEKRILVRKEKSTSEMAYL